MAIRLHIPKRQIAGLAILRDTEIAKLEAVNSALLAVGPALHPERLESAVAKVLDQEAAVDVLRQLVSVSAVMRQHSLTATQVFQGLTRGLENVPTESKWLSEEIDRWTARRETLITLFDNQCVHVAAKALELSYDYANLLQSIRIITDLRPVFDDNALTIQGLVVAQTLRVAFDTGNDTQTLSIAMDLNDIKHLRKSCDRAIQKADVASDKFDVEVAFPGTNGEGEDATRD